MSAKELVELNHRHMAIAEYLINHPSARLQEVAEAVGMSVSWVSIVSNSELFRDYFMRRHREVSNLVHIPLQDKLHGVAHLAVEKLGRSLEESTDPNFILAAADKALKNLGYGNPKSPQVQVNNLTQVHAPMTNVSADVVNAARAKIYQIAGVQEGGNFNGTSLPPAEGVQTREDSNLGSSAPRPALVHQAQESPRQEGPGGSIREEGVRSPGGEFSSTFASESLD